MKFVFTADNGTSGTELWVSDGTAVGTVLLADLVAGATGSSPFNFADIGGGQFVFVTVSGSTANLWISDGTSGGTSTLKSFAVSSPADNPVGFTPFGNGFLFTGRDTTNGRELWISDGTTAGTVLLSNIMSGSASSGAGGYRVLGSKVLFAADNGLTGRELWVTDGTAAGTQLLKDINLTGASSPTLGVQIGNKLVFSADDGATGRELWVTDGTTGGTFQVKDIFAGTTGSFASRFTALGNKAIFLASDAAGGSEPWVTDGTGSGTMRLADIQPGAANSSIESFVIAGSKAYFTVINAINDNNTAFELWSTDGTPGGSFQIMGMPRGGYNTTLEPLTAFGDKIIFVAYDPVNGKEMWISDGTNGGTHILKDINPGAADGASTFGFGRPIVIGDKFYFRANDGINGYELWVSDGTAAGTVMLKNINAGVADSLPSNLLALSTGAASGSPTNIGLSASSVQEFRANGTVVANLSATDPDAGETFTFSLLNNAGGRFSIAGNQLRVANGLLFDFEQAASHGITVRVTDSDGNTFDKSFTITVTDVNPETIVGDSLGNVLVGGAQNDTFNGGLGNDTLDGGAGIDSMTGGGGDDIFIVDTSGDSTVEAASGGTDTTRASITHALRANIEDLELTGNASINATGNAMNNVITGNAGSNILNGLGGADLMDGLAGNDTYYADNALDTVTETSNAGIDIVRSTVNWTLGANVEKLYLLGSAANGTGNALSNFVYGNAAANIINGLAGADRYYGYGGDDLYIVDSAGDLVFETTAGAAGGGDTVQSSVNHTLAVNVENLTLTGAAAINATGNALANLIGGNSGANFIDGKLGNDTLTGGLGNDQFLFSTTLGASNVDTVTDFSVPNDTIRLDDSIFTGLTPAAYISAAQFTVGTAATDANHRVIYDSATGALYFDADGNGAGATKQFATVSTGLTMTMSDFYVF